MSQLLISPLAKTVEHSSLLSDLVCAVDLLGKQFIKRLNQLFWGGGFFNDMPDLPVEMTHLRTLPTPIAQTVS